MTDWEIINDDVINWANGYTGDKFHAMLTDCPYEYGFMGKGWDSTGVSFMSNTWRSLAKHLYPGAFIMVFGGARTWHRIAVAIEDAGFIIHPTMFVWTYTSGMPKGRKIDDQVDRILGEYENREEIGLHENPASSMYGSGSISRDVMLTKPATELASAWEGHRYNTQTLKPAAEPIILAQKPYEGKPVECMIESGAGALNIDDTRLHNPDRSKPDFFPCNYMCVHLPACNKEKCADGCNVLVHENNPRFFAARWQFERFEYGRPLEYSKVSVREREAGLDDFPTLDVGEVSSGGGYSKEYQVAFNARKTARKNTHPTLKPIDLNIELSTMLLPPNIYYSRILIPFSGTASEGIGASFAGWDHVTMVEIESYSCKIGAARIKWWLTMAEHYGTTNVRELLYSDPPSNKTPKQLKMRFCE